MAYRCLLMKTLILTWWLKLLVIHIAVDAAPWVCDPGPLVFNVSSGEVQDGVLIEASSTRPGRNLSQAWPNNPDQWWSPGIDSTKQWVQVEFGAMVEVHRAGIRGAGSVNCFLQDHYLLFSNGSRWYHYRDSTGSNFQDHYLLFSNGSRWYHYRDSTGSNFQVLSRASSSSQLLLTDLSAPHRARRVRWRFALWQTNICLQLELYGCVLPDQPPQGYIPRLYVVVRWSSPDPL